MPYGISKRRGGDTAASNAWMERCIASVQRKSGRSKLQAILICKTQYDKMGGTKHGRNRA